jgi:hypothetical protein
MLIARAYRTKLHLNHEQITRCKKHAGCARSAYNWACRASKRFEIEGKVRNLRRKALDLPKGCGSKFCLVGFSVEEQQRYGLQACLEATLIRASSCRARTAGPMVWNLRLHCIHGGSDHLS